jgi:hypothetical protein
LVILRRTEDAASRDEFAGRIDLAGAVCSCLGLAGLNYGLIAASVHGFARVVPLVALTVGIADVALFVVVERHAAAPMLPLELFRRPRFTAACLLTLTFYSSLYGLLFFLSLNLIQVQGYEAVQAGLAQLPVMLPILLLAAPVGRWIDRRGPGLLLAIGPIVAGLGFLMLARPGITAGPAAYWTQFLPALATIGIAMGLTVVPLSTTVVNSVPAQHAGLASGLNSALSRLSSVFGTAMLGPIVLFVFGGALAQDVDSLPLADETRQTVMSEAVNLAAADVAADLRPDTAQQLRQSIRAAYVRAFRTATCACALATFAAAVATFCLMRSSQSTEGAG